MTYDLSLKKIILWLFFYLVANLYALAQPKTENPYEYLGIAHNRFLSGIMTNCPGWSLQASPDSISNVAFRYSAVCFPQIGITKQHVQMPFFFNFSYEDSTKKEELMRALALPNLACAYLDRLLSIDDHPSRKLSQVVQDYRSIESQLLADTRLPDSLKVLPLACAAIGRYSAQFWAKDTTWYGDSSQVPFAKWSKADFYGLLKGLVFGSLLWVSLEQMKIKNPITYGAAVALTWPAIDSILFARKYRRGKIKDKSNPNKTWEVQP